MELSTTEKIMHSTLQIEMLDSSAQPVAYASGFIFGFCEDEENNTRIPAIVTNRHVLGKCPQIKLVFTLLKQDGSPDIGKTTQITVSTSFSIFHPDPSIDLAILPLAPILNKFKKQGIRVCFTVLSKNLIPIKGSWNHFDAIEDVTMVGYPRGLKDTVNNLPIFRRGITATHPDIDFQGKPIFLVDMACFPGSSGSPVFVLNEGSYKDKKTKSIFLGSRIHLLGIQYAVPKLTDVGELKTVPTTEMQTKPVMSSFINLGYIIKSTELLAFEPILNGQNQLSVRPVS